VMTAVFQCPVMIVVMTFAKETVALEKWAVQGSIAIMNQGSK